MNASYGPWRVVGRRGDGGMLVERDDAPGARFRLIKIRNDRPRVERLPPSAEACVIAPIDMQSDFWVLDDAHAIVADALIERAEQEERLPLEIAAAVAWPVLRTLRLLHRTHRVVLGQVSLMTLAIDRDGGVRLHGPLPDEHMDPRPLFSAGSCPPERVRGVPAAQLTPASDVFSVGAMLFRILAGRWAHEGNELFPVLTSILEDRVPQRLATLRPDLPATLEQAITRALAHDPAARFADAGELLDALRADLPDEATARAALVDLISRFEPTAPGRLTPAAPAPPAPPPPAPPSSPGAPLALPRALEPWREALQAFPEELALGVGQAVRRVARLIGPLRLDTDVRSGAPDGYRGVARRGPLERLLLSEWAVLLEVPDEFVRRAVMGEQLFIALAHKEPGGVRRSIALFDGGPRSLGRPRVVHLVILIALATRARDAGVRFAWGVVQDERRALIAELNPASVRRLLAGRSLQEASAVDGAEWAISLGDPSQADDLWLIGPRGLEQAVALGGGTRLVVEEAPDPALRRVEVTLTRPRMASRTVELELPPEPDCVRLVRDPFAPRTRVPAREGATAVRAMWFEPSGRRLIEQHVDGAITATHLQRTPREPVVSAVRRAVPAGEQILGASMSSNRLFTAETEAGEVVVRRLGTHGGLGQSWSMLVPPEAFPTLFAGDTATLAVDVKGRALVRAYLLDRRGELWVGEPGQKLRSHARRVIGLLQGGNRVLYAHRDGSGAIRLIREIDGRPEPVGKWRDGDASGLLWCAGATTVPGEGVVVRVDETTWSCAGIKPQVRLVAPPGRPVVGAAYLDGEFGLLFLGADRRALEWTSGSGQRSVVAMPTPIVRVALNPRAPTLACADEAGGLYVVDADGKRIMERAP